MPARILQAIVFHQQLRSVYGSSESTASDHGRRPADRRQSERVDGGTAGTAAHPGCAAAGADPALQPGAHSGTRRARQGKRRLRHLHRHERRDPLHEGGLPVGGGQADRGVRALFDGGGRAGCGRCRTGRAGLRREVLHRRRQLRPGRQQHAGLLRARSLQVPDVHPLAEAAPEDEPSGSRHAVGFLVALPRVAAPGDDSFFPIAGFRPRTAT